MQNMIKRILSLLLAAMMLLPAAAVADEAQEHEKGFALLQQGAYSEAADVFLGLNGYKDSNLMAMYCKACASAEAGDFDIAITSFRALGDFRDSASRLAYYMARAAEAAIAEGDWEAMERAKKAYSALADYLDSADRVQALTARISAAKAAQYDAAVADSEAGSYDAGEAAFRHLGNYRDSLSRITYYGVREAEAALAADDQDGAIAVAKRYSDMGKFLDCADRSAALTAKADAIVADKYAKVDLLTSQGLYADATAVLESFGEYGSGSVTGKYYAMGVHALDAGKWDEATEAFRTVSGYSDAKMRITYAAIRREEAALKDSTDQDAVLALTNRYILTEDYLDCAGRIAALNAQADAIVVDKYAQVEKLTAECKYADATDILTKFGAYGSGQVPEKYYAMGMHALEAGKWDQATIAFTKAGSYSDAPTRITYVAIRKEEALLANTTSQDKVIAVAKRYMTMGSRYDCVDRAAALTARADAIVADKYARAEALIAEGEYSAATTELKNFGTYGNEQRPEMYYKIGDAALAAGKWSDAEAAYKNAGAYSDAATCIVYTKIRKDEENLVKSTDQDAVVAVADRYKALKDFRDSAERSEALMKQADAIVADKYMKAEDLMAKGRYSEASAVLENFGKYGNSRVPEMYYKIGETAEKAGDRRTALVAYRNAGMFRYSDSIRRAFVLTSPMGIGNDHVVARLADGKLASMGYNTYNQINVSGWKSIVALCADKNHTVGLRADGTVVATGTNTSGQCKVTDWSNIVMVATGAKHTVGLRADGTVVAKGSNTNGQCNVTGWKDIVAVAAGEGHTVGLKADGTVVATGSTYYKQCSVTSWKNIVAIAAGDRFTVGLKADGTVVATGFNTNNQCSVSSWRNIISIVCGDEFTVGPKADGTVVAVGKNNAGQCKVTGWKDVVAIVASDDCTVGVKADGGIYAAGTYYTSMKEWNLLK